jgi:SH3-like domain-containing protein
MRLLLLPILFFVTFTATAGNFRAVEESGAVLYDAPSREATPVYVVSRDYPLEVLVEVEAWVKVRDAAGAISWIEKRQLGERRTVVVIATSADAHLRPEDDAPLAFVASQNVALELLESAPAGWVHVRHADGADGYLRAALVWGI